MDWQLFGAMAPCSSSQNELVAHHPMILSVARHLWRRWHAMLAARAATLPVNLRKIEVSSETISADVEYAVRIGEEYVTLVRGISDDIRERSVLELGPGINFGSSLV